MHLAWPQPLYQGHSQRKGGKRLAPVPLSLTPKQTSFLSIRHAPFAGNRRALPDCFFIGVTQPAEL